MWRTAPPWVNPLTTLLVGLLVTACASLLPPRKALGAVLLTIGAYLGLNGIVFFDECDDLLTEGTHLSRLVLIEIEKARCITILATNQAFRLDPSFERRITMKVPFAAPDRHDE